MLEEYFEEKNTWKYIKGEQWGRKISQQGILQLFVKARQIAMYETSQQFPNNWKMFPNKDQSTRRILWREQHQNQSFCVHLNELQTSQFINKITAGDATGSHRTRVSWPSANHAYIPHHKQWSLRWQTLQVLPQARKIASGFGVFSTTFRLNVLNL